MSGAGGAKGHLEACMEEEEVVFWWALELSSVKAPAAVAPVAMVFKAGFTNFMVVVFCVFRFVGCFCLFLQFMSA